MDVTCESYGAIVLGILHGGSHNLKDFGEGGSIVFYLDEIYATELRRDHVYIHRIFRKYLLVEVVMIPSAHIVHKVFHSKLGHIIVVQTHT